MFNSPAGGNLLSQQGCKKSLRLKEGMNNKRTYYNIPAIIYGIIYIS